MFEIFWSREERSHARFPRGSEIRGYLIGVPIIRESYYLGSIIRVPCFRKPPPPPPPANPKGMMANKSSKHMIYMVLFAQGPRNFRAMPKSPFNGFQPLKP